MGAVRFFHSFDLRMGEQELSKSQRDGERIVVGSRYRAMDLGFDCANRSARKNPVDGPPLL
jgi:hypothetical protein